MANSDYQETDELLTRLLRRLERQEAELAQETERLARLEKENQRLRKRRDALLTRQGKPRPLGVQVAMVAGDGGQGQSAATDAQGRVPVKVYWDGQEHELLARVATDWNLPGGGSSFLARKGQAVYLSFENGDPALPVIIGYHPNQNNPLAYDPSSTSPEGVLARTADAQGQAYNPPTPNRYKSVIRTSSQGAAAKASEIALGDQPGQESLTMASQGDLLLHSMGDQYQTVGGKTVASHQGDKTQFTNGQYQHIIDKNYTRQVKGDHTSRVSGSQRETVSGDYQLSIPGQYTNLAATGRSVHTLTESDTYGLYLGGKNLVILGEEFVAGLGITIFLYIMLEDFFIQGLNVSVINLENNFSSKSNVGAKVKNTLAQLATAAANIKDQVLSEDNTGLLAEDVLVGLEIFAAKVNNGMKINF